MNPVTDPSRFLRQRAIVGTPRGAVFFLANPIRVLTLGFGGGTIFLALAGRGIWRVPPVSVDGFLVAAATPPPKGIIGFFSTVFAGGGGLVAIGMIVGISFFTA